MSFSFNNEVLDCVLGPAKGEGNKMAQWAMKCNVNLLPYQTMRPLNVEELNSKAKIRSYKLFDSLIERR
eukprot:2114558-Ditylum_brightwellii.AAC.1